MTRIWFALRALEMDRGIYDLASMQPNSRLEFQRLPQCSCSHPLILWFCHQATSPSRKLSGGLTNYFFLCFLQGLDQACRWDADGGSLSAAEVPLPYTLFL